MNVIFSLFEHNIARIVGDYLLTSDSAHLGAEPSFVETKKTCIGDKCHKYWETRDNKRYYGEMETKTGYGVTRKRVWYDMQTAEPRASQNPGEPVCWLDSGLMGKPHRIGAPAWGTEYYVDGYRLPPEIGKIFKPEIFYTMKLESNQLVFGPGNLHLKYTNGRLIIHGDPVVVPGHMETRKEPLGWGRYQTIDEFIREYTIPAFDSELPSYIESKKSIVWGY